MIPGIAPAIITRTAAEIDGFFDDFSTDRSAEYITGRIGGLDPIVPLTMQYNPAVPELEFAQNSPWNALVTPEFEVVSGETYEVTIHAYIYQATGQAEIAADTGHAQSQTSGRLATIGGRLSGTGLKSVSRPVVADGPIMCITMGQRGDGSARWGARLIHVRRA